MSRTRSTIERSLGLCLALTLVAALFPDNESICPGGHRVLESADVGHAGEPSPGSVSQDCEGDLCNTPSLTRSPVAFGPASTLVSEALTEPCALAGLEESAPPTPPPKPQRDDRVR